MTPPPWTFRVGRGFNLALLSLFALAPLVALPALLRRQGLHPSLLLPLAYGGVMGAAGWGVWKRTPWGRVLLVWLSWVSLVWNALVLLSMGALGPFLVSYYPASPLVLWVIRQTYARAPIGIREAAGVLGLYGFALALLALDGGNLLWLRRPGARAGFGGGEEGGDQGKG